MIPSILVLGSVAIAALALAQGRRTRSNPALRRAAAVTLAIVTGVQGIHFAEEAVTGFPERLGALLGLPAMPLAVFIGFNVTWLGIWLASIAGVRSARNWAFFAAWFLAIGGMVNGVAHPLLAFAAGGYFPGLITSPVIGLGGVWLWRKLDATTEPRNLN